MRFASLRLLLFGTLTLILVACQTDIESSEEHRAVVEERDLAREQVATLASDLAELTRSLDGAVLSIDGMSAQIDELTSEVRELNRENSELRRELESASSERDQLRTKLDTLDPTEVVGDINDEIRRLCGRFQLSGSGNTVAEAASLVEYLSRWEPFITADELADRAATCAAFEYLTRVALEAEFGDQPPGLIRWVGDVRIRVEGDPTEADLASLNETISDLNRLVETVDVSIVSGSANMVIHFVPRAEFRSVLAGVPPNHDGYVTVRWSFGGRITSATVLINSGEPDQVLRDHTIREEVTQGMGLLQDTVIYPDSIFDTTARNIVSFSAIDEMVIAMVYDPGIRPGMSEEALRRFFGWEYEAS